VSLKVSRRENLLEEGFGGKSNLRDGVDVYSPFSSVLLLGLGLFRYTVPDGSETETVLDDRNLVWSQTCDNVIKNLFENRDGNILVRAKEPSQRGNVRDLKRPFIYPGRDVFQHCTRALHKQIEVHIEADEAVHVRARHEFIDVKLIEKNLDLVDRGAESRRIIEKFGFRGVRKFVGPEGKGIIDADKGFEGFDKALAICLQF